MSEADHSPSGKHAARAALWLFLFLNFLFILTSSGRVRVTDEVLPAFQTESLVERRSTAIPQAVEAQLFYGRFDQRGQAQAPYPPGQAFVAIPWYLAGRHVLARLPGVPDAAQQAVTDFVVVLSNATFSALAAALAFLIFVRSGVPLRAALWATMVLALATPLAAYSSWYFSEPLAVALFFAATLLLFARPEEAALPDTWCLAAGALLGATLWVRPTHALLAGVFLLALVLSGRKRRWQAVAYVGVIVILFGLALLLRNAFLYDSFFEFGYPDAAEGGKRLNSFETPLATGLAAFLFSPGKSIFLFAPPLMVALAALPQLWRRRRGLALVAAMSLPALILVYATYTQFEGGYCFGPRYLVTGMALACLPLGVVAAEGSRVRRKLLAGLFVAGVAVNFIGMTTSPLEDQATGKYYDASFNYRLDYNPLAGQGALLVKYLADGKSAPIGRGFGFWFVYLHKAGVAAGTLWFIAALAAIGATLSAWRLHRLCAEKL